MKNCPNCQEILGDNVVSCFKCKYDFKLKRIPNMDDIKKMNDLRREKEKEEEQKRIEEEEKRNEEQRKRNEEQQKMKQAQEEYMRLQQTKEENRAKNALYEYEVVVLTDKPNGGFDVGRYMEILKKYSENGWRLKTVFSNELGKNSSSLGYGGVSGGTNSTIEQTIITFERCIRPNSF